MSLQRLLQEITSSWVVAKSETFAKHRIHESFVALRNEIDGIVAGLGLENDFVVKQSRGAGNWADVPWVAILETKETTSTQNGIYPVLLFRADGSGVYLSLNQGTTAPQKELGSVRARRRAADIAKKVRTALPEVESWGDPQIDLKASTNLGKSYEPSNISARFYKVNEIPPDEEIQKDIEDITRYYVQVLERKDEILGSGDTQSDAETTLNTDVLRLAKPFILLAGISGTGKTRFVREQARRIDPHLNNYCLVSVRPDWHEPTDLLGYVSRLGPNGAEFVTTDVLRFLVKAWKDVIQSVNLEGEKPHYILRPLEEASPFWLCLDEMNLAPVEQYFADYLSVLETREFRPTHNGYTYSCDPLLKPVTLADLSAHGAAKLKDNLELDDALWALFSQTGIGIPPNLILAGTVNMDETTHGFSRKVLDRALTFDFGEFFPNTFENFFGGHHEARLLSFPLHTQATRDCLQGAAADPDGAKTIAFLTKLNGDSHGEHAVLKTTPFELAYRALNEALLMVACFKPQTSAELQAVWDDFLMMKVLPRIEGDMARLGHFPGMSTGYQDQERTLLTELESFIREQLAQVIQSGRVNHWIESETPLMTPCKSLEKVVWMNRRLTTSGFTTFWP